jgi:serine/threonine protein phosphatase PrpC
MIAADAEPAKILRGIVDLANARGGLDNSTGVLVFVDDLS